ncbi:MAG: ribonuclease P protein component [Bacillota bacterium]
MKREERLRKNYEFKKVYQGGKSRAAQNTVIYYRRNECGFNRLGVSISKKVGKSVVRHRLKRLYSEAFYRMKDKMQKGYDIIVVARKGAARLRFGDVLVEMTGLLKRGKIIK